MTPAHGCSRSGFSWPLPTVAPSQAPSPGTLTSHVAHSTHCSITLLPLLLETSGVTSPHFVDSSLLSHVMNWESGRKVQFATSFFCIEVCLLFLCGLQFSFQILCGCQGSTALLLVFPRLLNSNVWILNLRQLDLLLFSAPPSS